MATEPTSLHAALKSALDQGLISLRGIQADTGVSRNTARAVVRGERHPNPATRFRLWAYLREKGAA